MKTIITVILLLINITKSNPTENFSFSSIIVLNLDRRPDNDTISLAIRSEIILRLHTSMLLSERYDKAERLLALLEHDDHDIVLSSRLARHRLLQDNSQSFLHTLEVRQNHNVIELVENFTSNVGLQDNEDSKSAILRAIYSRRASFLGSFGGPAAKYDD